MSRRIWVGGLTACALLLAAAVGAQAQEKLEIFSWWTGDRSPALQALVQKFNALFPDVAVTNAAAVAEPGADPRTVLRTRLLEGDPPDSFQARGGRNLIDTWVIADRLQDVRGFYRAQGWTSVLPRELVALLSTKAGIWSVPLAVNRCNVLWYVPSRLKGWGVFPPRTLAELFNDCQTLKTDGVLAPIAAGDESALNQLWDSVAVATVGPDAWSALFDGRMRFTDPRAVRIWENFAKVLDSTSFANAGAPGPTWQQDVDKVVKGESAFVVTGDWAESYLAGTLKLVPGSDFAWIPAPGTNGVFVARVDSFCLPRGFKNVASVYKWLTMVGNRDAQDAFNRLNGSISPRLDADSGSYSAYFQSAARDWRESRIVGSMASGIAAPDSFVSQFADAMGVFLATRDPRAGAYAAQAIADMTRLGE